MLENHHREQVRPYIRMGEIGTVGIWSPKTRSTPEFVHWAVHGPHAPSCPGRRAKKIGSFFLQNFEIVNLVSAHLASAVRSAKKSKAPANISVGKETSMDLPKVRGPISKTLKKVAAYRHVTVESSKILILKFQFQFSSLHHTILKPETHNSYCSPTLLTKPTHSTC